MVKLIKSPMQKGNVRKEVMTMRAARDKKPGFDSEFTGSSLRIKLRGEIDHHSAVAIRSSIDDIIKSKRPVELVVDMSAVDFMDSSGLGLIMGRYAVMKELGGELVVCDPSPRTEKIMSLAGMERIVKIKHTSPSHKSSQAMRTTAQTQMASPTMAAANSATNKCEQSKKSSGKRTVKRNDTKRGDF